MRAQINLSLDPNLRDMAHAEARRRGITLAELVRRGLEEVVAPRNRAMPDDPDAAAHAPGGQQPRSPLRVPATPAECVNEARQALSYALVFLACTNDALAEDIARAPAFAERASQHVAVLQGAIHAFIVLAVGGEGTA